MNKTGGAFSARRFSDGGQQRFFATKMASDSIGEKEDPRQARRIKLTQVAMRDNLLNNDMDISNMMYGTPLNTQKKLVAVKSIRQSVKEQQLDDQAVLDRHRLQD